MRALLLFLCELGNVISRERTPQHEHSTITSGETSVCSQHGLIMSWMF